MANSDLQAESARNNPAEQVHSLALQVQALSRRVEHLADGTLDAIDQDLDSRAYYFSEMISEVALKLANHGEEIEVLSNVLRTKLVPAS